MKNCQLNGEQFCGSVFNTLTYVVYFEAYVATCNAVRALTRTTLLRHQSFESVCDQSGTFIAVVEESGQLVIG